MKEKWLVVLLFAFVLGLGSSLAHAGNLPKNASFTTLVITPLAIEGLTGDATGNLYTTGRDASPTACPVWRINPANPLPLVIVGRIPNPTGCNPSGITFDAVGNLYIADAASGGIVWTLTPNDATPPTATAFATAVPGANGLAFDKAGNLWTGDGTTGQGRVWKITGPGANCGSSKSNCEEVFRIQPMRNSMALGGDLAGDGVGRQARTFPPGTLANNVGGQDLVANGLAFNQAGDLFILDTARGAIWRAQFKDGSLTNEVGCDTTFTANTLCLDSVFVAYPYLEGADGVVLDTDENMWVAANERNAIVVVSKEGKVTEVFRNDPDPTTNLRNAGPLEFPTSPFISGKRFCTSNSDGDRRDNSPHSAGEVHSLGAVGTRAKISCITEELDIPGLPLPVR